MNTVSLDERRELCAADVTLNGNRAVISGASMPFAHVTDFSTGLSAEWAWPTVRHIVQNKNGAFKS